MEIQQDKLREIISAEREEFGLKFKSDWRIATPYWVARLSEVGISTETTSVVEGIWTVYNFANFANNNPDCVFCVGDDPETFDDGEVTWIYAVPKELAAKILVLGFLPPS